MSTYTFIDLAIEALQAAPHPLVHREIWDFAVARKLDKRLKTSGKTPWDTLSARVYVSTAEDVDSPFLRIGARPSRFWLKSRRLPKGWSMEGPEGDTAALIMESTPEGGPAPDDTRHGARITYLERDLHPLVASFAHEKMGGVRVKTIRHESSKKNVFGEWVHPDLIGVRFPMVGLHPITAAFSAASQISLLRLFSFELKRRITFSNLRECFFQAVSNSSWAHEGYLVAAEWDDGQEFADELQRLCNAFGLGAIELCLSDPAQSRIRVPAKQRDEVDWATLDKLVSMNRDVQALLESARIDVGAGRIHASEYDKLPESPSALGLRLLRKRV